MANYFLDEAAVDGPQSMDELSGGSEDERYESDFVIVDSNVEGGDDIMEHERMQQAMIPFQVDEEDLSNQAVASQRRGSSQTQRQGGRHQGSQPSQASIQMAPVKVTQKRINPFLRAVDQFDALHSRSCHCRRCKESNR